MDQMQQERLDNRLMRICMGRVGGSVKSALDQGANPRKVDKDGDSPLMHAAWRGLTATIELLAPVSDLEQRNADGATAYLVSASKGHLAGLRLLRPGSDPLARDHYGATALHRIASAKDAEFGELTAKAMRFALQASDPLARDNAGRTPLMEACSAGNFPCVELLIPVSDLGARDEKGRSAGELLAESKRLWIPQRQATLDKLRALEEALELRGSLRQAEAPRQGPRAL